ncbi:3-deoxy-7-phosphoheptulonate synthase [Nocardia niwae]|uniref:3-deoxy-7-phosphoheptulonate synthase n=1 Tax=Nocardia niwae TaxID=626084 RepID=UPI0007A3C38F|nr:3-deoxy-7-phosphoheptulonate synthase [Nocardia niwae]
MTITHTGPEPPGDCPPGGSGFPNHDELGRFGHPLTRALLASDGFTTPALAAVLGTDLKVRVLRQDDIAAGRLPATVTDVLRVSGADRLIVRRSCLVNADLVTASVNYVVAVRAGATASGVDDVRVPIGSGLISRGMAQRRRLLRTGVLRWPDGRLCAARSYVMLLGDRPVCYIRESFNPDVIPPEYAATAGDDPPWADEPEPAHPGSLDDPEDDFAVRAPYSDERTLEESAPPLDRAQRSRLLPGPIHPAECVALTAGVAKAARGEGFVLHLGSRDDTFSGGETRTVAVRRALMYAVAAVMAHALGEATVTIERAPGPSRTPATLDGWPGNHLPITLCATILRRAADGCRDPVRRDLLRAVGGLLPIAAITPPGAHELHASIAPPRISREPSLPYEAAPTRQEPHGEWWDRSAHMLWIGDHTGNCARDRMRSAARVGNPVAVALGPTTTPYDVEMLCRALNPRKQPGRLTLVPRLGVAGTLDTLPALFAAAAACETPVCWVCDPMPTTPRTRFGQAAFRFDDVLDGIHAFFRTCRATGTVPGGLHLECGTDVVERWADDPEGKHFTGCRSRRSPGLDPVQTLHCVVAALEQRVV